MISEKNNEREVLFIPGSLKSPFVINELPYLTHSFERCIVITFDKMDQDIEKLSQDFGLETYAVTKKNAIMETLHLIKWLRLEHVKREIKSNCNWSLKGLKKLLYIILYGLYEMATERVLRKINLSEQMYVYSYWLSRPAFIAASVKMEDFSKTIRCLSRAHGYDLYEKRNQLNYLPFREYILESLDGIGFISENGKTYAKEKYEEFGIDSHKYFVSHLGTKGNGRQKVISDKREILIASCSSVIDIKRLDLIVKVIEFLQKQSEQDSVKVKWMHLGDGQNMKEIQILAQTKLETESYHFCGNVANNKILQKYLDEDVDFFINMSDSEGIPVSVMEAISIGIPAIGRNVGGMSEIINSRTGLLLNESETDIDYEGIYKFVMSRLEDKKYNELSNSTVKFWKENFDSDNNYNAFYSGFIQGDY